MRQLLENLNHHLLWLLLLPLLSLSFWLLGPDASHLLVWWLALSVPGWLAWPWVARLFPDGDRGYLLAKGIGLLLPAFLLWTLSHLHLLPFSNWTIWLLLLFSGAAAWVNKRNRFAMSEALAEASLTRRIVAAEAFFLSALLFWTFARGLKPDLDSLEKFMNVGFMNSLWRTRWLPAPDIWFSGSSINYYYFGHYLYTYLARLSGIRPEVSYNLGMATTFALTASLSYSAGSRLIALLCRDERKIPAIWRTSGGLVSALLVTTGGNGHAFFFSPHGPGRSILQRAAEKGLAINLGDAYWFADATRFIGYNPDTADKTIHEFPFYSFLVADLHAHVINLAFVLMLLILLTALVVRPRLCEAAAACRSTQEQLTGSDDATWHRLELRAMLTRWRAFAADPVVWLAALLLTVFMMANYWDFAIYMAASSLVLLQLNSRAYGRPPRLAGVVTLLLQVGLVMIPFLWFSHPLAALAGFALAAAISHYLTLICGDGLTLTGAQVSWLFFLSHALALPFNLSFEPIAKSIARTVASTPFWQLLVLWGPHLAAGIIFLAALFILQIRPRTKCFPPPEVQAAFGHDGLFSWLRPFTRADILAVSLFAWAVCLLVLPELVYVVDIYSGDYKRANTMFKFTYQAYVLLSLVWAYALIRLLSLRQRSIIRLAGVVLAILLLFPAWYPVPAAQQWLGSFSRSRYLGLDGLDRLEQKASPQLLAEPAGALADDVAAIRWFNEQVPGHPVILETHGESYTDYGRISAFTGLPTVMGWETHEWLWRTSKEHPNAYADFVLPRQTDVTTLYTTEDQAERLALIEQYAIRYIVIGSLERTRFRADPEDMDSPSLVREEQLRALGPVVFSSGSLLVIQVQGGPG